MNTPAFVQIAVSDGFIYGLDGMGCVWWFNANDKYWVRIPNEAAPEK